jgi:hypothetical protein
MSNPGPMGSPWVPMKMGLYRHHKGGLYSVFMDIAFDSETAEERVIYMSMKDGRIWVRPRQMFCEDVTWPDGTKAPRFKLVWGD